MKIKLVKTTKNPHIHNYTNVIKSKRIQKELISNPVLKNSFNNSKNLKLNCLSKIKRNELLSKSNDISSDLILNPQKAKLKSKMESFYKIYNNFNKNLKISKNKINSKEQELNANLRKIYDSLKEHTFFSRNQMLDEIREKYNKNNISLPLIENKNNSKNLFKKNLLLSLDGDIKKSILYNLFDENNNSKSISFFKKIENNIDKDLYGKNDVYLKETEKEMQKEKEENKEKSLPIKSDNRKSKFDNEQSIEKSIDEINKIRDTLNNIEDLDLFYDANNKDYLKYLKGELSKDNSKNSTGFCLLKNDYLKSKLNMKKNNKNITNKSFFASEEKNEDRNIKNINKYINKFNNNNKRKSNINLYRNQRKSCINNMNLKRKSFCDYNKNELDTTFQRFQRRIQKNNTTKIIIKKIKLNDRKFLDKNKSIPNYETIYNKIKDNDDLKNNSKLIKSFLPEGKYNLGIKFFPLDLFNNYKNTRKRILKNNFYKTFSKLKYKSGFKVKQNENIEMKEKENELKMKTIENQIEELASKIK